jgi:hypothetical protein
MTPNQSLQRTRRKRRAVEFRRWAVRMRSTNHHVSTAHTPFRHLTAYGETI